MIVRLVDIRTIGDAFKSGALKTAAKLRYKPNAAYLDRISLFQGDITLIEVDSIVNAANRSLLGEGFHSCKVDGAIHAAAGRGLLKECMGLGGCETGESKITAAYKLPSKHIIHTVGPVYSRNDVETRAQQLQSCYRTSLNLAIENNLKHIAFPSISTGIYGYPIEDATHIALDLVRRFYDSDLDRVIFVVWSNKDKEVYETLIPEYFPDPDSPQDGPSGEAPATDEPSDKPAAGPPAEAPVPGEPPQTSGVETDTEAVKAPAT
ncbi:A1pp-domain-containing protein [Mycena galericulata]|nr:A1pp-domain-containing protein [Mycena galericulata]